MMVARLRLGLLCPCFCADRAMLRLDHGAVRPRRPI